MAASRHLAAIMFTDIVGSTAMMQQDETQAVTKIKRYTSVLRQSVGAHHGKILNDYGDGSLCSFRSAIDAAQCAIAMQRELQNEPTVPLRIGLHIGEIVFEDKKVFGDGVNVASRIQSLGEANTILVSKEFFDKLKNHTEFKAVSLGSFDFKHVDEPVEVFAMANEGLVVPAKKSMAGKVKEIKKKNKFRRNVIIAATGLIIMAAAYFIYSKYSEQESVEGEKTIAVLPFKNVSVNKQENEPFCIGVALELQKKLELLGGLIPIAPQSVEKYRETKLSIPDIANELGGVKYILQGNVLRDNDKVKVFVSLVDASTDKEIWSDDFPGEVKDIFSLQENIAQQIATALKVKITPDEQGRIKRIASENTIAIDAYNEALTAYVKLLSTVHALYWDSLPSNPQLYSDYLNTLSLCDNAIHADPSMAEAYVLKGQTYMYRISGWTEPNTKQVKLVLDSSRFLANKALQIDASSADAYLLLSKCVRDSTIFYLERALSINPNNFDVNRELGGLYAWRDPETAIPFSKKAIRLNPVSVFTPLAYRDLGFAYHTCGDFEKAELYGKKAVELSNANTMIRTLCLRYLTIIYLHWGKGDSAIKYANAYLKEDRSRETNALYEIAEAYCNLKNDCGTAAVMYDSLWRRYPLHTVVWRWAVALINSGNIQEAKQKIQLAEKEFRKGGRGSYDMLSYDYAGFCSLKGDKETALRILRQWRWNWGSAYLIQHDKLFDNIRNEKEFREILQRALDQQTKVRERIDEMEKEGKL